MTGRTVRIGCVDPQGKGYAQILLDIGVSVPAELALRDGLSAQQAA